MIVDIVFGFLGSGKTTFITRVLNEWGGKEKIVVLVNEFGEVGVDGALLREQGGNVVEMPSGCICCTLQTDFRTQLLDIMENIQPERVIIEPTGVATIAQIRSIVEAQLFEKAIQEIRYILIADATGFMSLYKANPHFVESQVKNARLVLLNKCDRVDKRKAMLVRDAISAINPEATVISTEFGEVDWGQYQLALSTPLGSSSIPEQKAIFAEPPQEAEEGEGFRLIHLQDQADALGYESFGLIYDDINFDEKSLFGFFQRLQTDDLGEVVRAKGIFLIGNKSVLMDLASGELSSQSVPKAERSRVSIIGRKLNRKEIGALLELCASLS